MSGLRSTPPDPPVASMCRRERLQESGGRSYDQGNRQVVVVEQHHVREEAEAVSVDLQCCFIGCGEPAEFEIIDQADRRPDCAVTHACEMHVGALLGHQTDLPADVENAWMVIVL